MRVLVFLSLKRVLDPRLRRQLLDQSRHLEDFSIRNHRELESLEFEALNTSSSHSKPAVIWAASRSSCRAFGTLPRRARGFPAVRPYGSGSWKLGFAHLMMAQHTSLLIVGTLWAFLRFWAISPIGSNEFSKFWSGRPGPNRRRPAWEFCIGFDGFFFCTKGIGHVSRSQRPFSGCSNFN
jgi:hypothetical protein